MGFETAAIAAVAETTPAQWMSAVAWFIKSKGVAAALVIVFIFWGYQREKTLNARNDSDIKFERDTMVTAINNDTTAVTSLKTLVERLVEERR